MRNPHPQPRSRILRDDVIVQSDMKYYCLFLLYAVYVALPFEVEARLSNI
jgi:hypothetical protein